MRRAALAWAVLWTAGAAAALPPSPRGQKPYGVLLLGEGGDAVWKNALAAVRRDLPKEVPFEFAAGLADGREVQKGVDRLASRGVRQIVAVPLFISSFSEVMDHNRFLLGIRETPSKEFLGAARNPGRMDRARRVESPVPLVLTKALDDHPLLVELAAQRARAQSRDAGREGLILVAPAPASPEAAKDALALLAALAEKVRLKGGFKAAKAFALRADAEPARRRGEEDSLRRLVSEMRRQAAPIVVALELSPGALSRRLPRVLDGLFFRFDGKGLLPDERVSRWVAASAEAGSRLPDMRVFRGRPAARGVR